MKKGMWRELLFALSIVAVCVVIHTVGLVLFGQFLIDRFPKLERVVTMRRQVIALMLVFAVVLTLHLIEASLWAAFYYWRNLFQDFETALYFSLVTYGTMGFGDVVLPQRWRLLSGIEGISGVLLCGLSGAFIFAVINALFKRRMQLRNSPVKTYSSSETGTD
jgi:hypothetical protein